VVHRAYAPRRPRDFNIADQELNYTGLAQVTKMVPAGFDELLCVITSLLKISMLSGNKRAIACACDNSFNNQVL